MLEQRELSEQREAVKRMLLEYLGLPSHGGLGIRRGGRRMEFSGWVCLCRWWWWGWLRFGGYSLGSRQMILLVWCFYSGRTMRRGVMELAKGVKTLPSDVLGRKVEFLLIF